MEYLTNNKNLTWVPKFYIYYKKKDASYLGAISDAFFRLGYFDLYFLTDDEVFPKDHFDAIFVISFKDDDEYSYSVTFDEEDYRLSKYILQNINNQNCPFCFISQLNRNSITNDLNQYAYTLSKYQSDIYLSEDCKERIKSMICECLPTIGYESLFSYIFSLKDMNYHLIYLDEFDKFVTILLKQNDYLCLKEFLDYYQDKLSFFTNYNVVGIILKLFKEYQNIDYHHFNEYLPILKSALEDRINYIYSTKDDFSDKVEQEFAIYYPFGDYIYAAIKTKIIIQKYDELDSVYSDIVKFINIKKEEKPINPLYAEYFGVDALIIDEELAKKYPVFFLDKYYRYFELCSLLYPLRGDLCFRPTNIAQTLYLYELLPSKQKKNYSKDLISYLQWMRRSDNTFCVGWRYDQSPTNRLKSLLLNSFSLLCSYIVFDYEQDEINDLAYDIYDIGYLIGKREELISEYIYYYLAVSYYLEKANGNYIIENYHENIEENVYQQVFFPHINIAYDVIKFKKARIVLLSAALKGYRSFFDEAKYQEELSLFKETYPYEDEKKEILSLIGE